MYSCCARMQADAHRCKCGGENNEATASIVKMTGGLAQTLLFGTWHRLLLHFGLSPMKSPWSDWSTRFSLTNFIGWLISDVTDEEALLGFLGQPKSDKNDFLSELYWTRQFSANFCPIFLGKKQCLSQAVYFKIWKRVPIKYIFQNKE